ncbi:hypothetical protein [Paenibacillus sp. N3.4]|uniref:hypothetical protein n=1 Tax=Paenibacillus sp. N3.4 TaxID=2603222 RepID=UPI001C9D111D|nr:hypothetical protein [Paenibacillus sp. N3.4]
MNSVLSKNYYTASLFENGDAKNISKDSIAHEMLADGKAISLFASSNDIVNSGLANTLPLEELKKTFYYFIYNLYSNQNNGESRTDSFFHATKTFEEETLKHQDLKWEPNYQVNLINMISLQNLGVFEY